MLICVFSVCVLYFNRKNYLELYSFLINHKSQEEANADTQDFFFKKISTHIHTKSKQIKHLLAFVEQ